MIWWIRPEALNRFTSMSDQAKPEFLSLIDLLEEVSFYLSSYSMDDLLLDQNGNSNEKVIVIKQDPEKVLSINVENSLKAQSMSLLYLSLTFGDNECDLISYFLQQYKYGLCHLTASNGETHIKVYSPLAIN